MRSAASGIAVRRTTENKARVVIDGKIDHWHDASA
jgi:hypothetical protein